MNATPSFVKALAFVLSACAYFIVALTAVNRFAIAGLERYFSVFPTLRADRGEHLSYGPVITIATAVSLFLFSGGAAGGATLRLIGVASVCKRFLLVGGKSERNTAIGANDGFVLKTHLDDLLFQYFI